jgi:Domain of unknown function (DUF4398)
LTEKSRPFWFGLCVILVICSFPGFVRAQEISPAQEQEFIDAKAALEAAQKAQAEKYALENLKQAQGLLGTADRARKIKDSVKFTQASRLARVYAELAQALAELKSEEERLAAAREELQGTKAAIDRLKKSP